MDKADEVNLGLEAEVSEVPCEEAHCLDVEIYATASATRSINKTNDVMFD